MRNSGWLYLIRNGDLYKIGITKNINNRMHQLKPDNVIAKLYSLHFKKLEKELHKKYKDVRIPQTEYFRLNNSQIKEIKKRISKFDYPINITFHLFIKSICLILLLFLISWSYFLLTINDANQVISNTLMFMERILYGLSLLSLFINSNKYLSFFNELKFRTTKSTILFIFAFFFRFTSIIIFF